MTTPENTQQQPDHETVTEQAALDAPFMRQIKTYVLRAGRMGSGQVRAFEQFGPQFLVPYCAERLDVQAAFGRSAPLILEIGFGMGDATAKIAQVRPGDNFLCCEVHEPGVGALLKRCGEEHIANIRIESFKIMDEELSRQISQHVLTTAKIKNEMANLEGNCTGTHSCRCRQHFSGSQGSSSQDRTRCCEQVPHPGNQGQSQRHANQIVRQG